MSAPNKAEFVFSDGVIWDQPFFVDLMLDSFVERVEGRGQFLLPVQFMTEALQAMPAQCASWLPPIGEGQLTQIISLIQGLAMFSQAMPVKTKNDEKLLEFISDLRNHISVMVKGTYMLLPGGWSSERGGDQVLIYMLERKGDTFSFGVCNTGGPGIEYHPITGESTADIKYKMSLVIDDIPAYRVTDSAFWYMLYRMQVYPGTNQAQFFYETLLPWLNGKPLTTSVLANTTGIIASTPWDFLPRAGDSSLANLILQAVMLVLSRKGLSIRHAAYFSLLTRWQLCLMLFHDMQVPHYKMSELDAQIIKNVLKQFAMYTTQETLEPETAVVNSGRLTQVLNFLTEVGRRVGLTGADNVPLVNIRDGQFEAYPSFDGFARDDNVERYAGPADLAPMFRPVEMTLVKDRVTTFNELADTLRYADNICTLLQYQENQIRYAHFYIVSLINYMFTHVIPIPLPMNHPQKKMCFFSQPIRFETQFDLIRILHHLCSHFAGCSMALGINREFDAARILTLAAMATIADALIRMRASDIPSLISLHLTGTAPPTPRYFFQPFGFDITSFRIQSEDLVYHAPEQVTTRTRILDYHMALADVVKDDHIIFHWETSHQPANLLKLFDQICWEVGFPSDEMPYYISGERTEFIYNYPEFMYYRDIVFLFKYLMCPTPDALPEVKPYYQKDARLFWSFKEGEGYTIQGFGRNLKCVYPTLDEKKETKDVSFFSRLFKKQTRAGPSGADPSALTGEKIDNEEAVLHVPTMPNFNGKLSQAASELLISYLTAPYLRIPLVLNFFACSEHIHSLSQLKLQNVLDAIMFEPGAWHPPKDKKIPATIPSPDRSFLATPLGLLFNELKMSPHALLKPIADLLEFALELDSGRFTPETGSTILYVVRLVIRVEGFIQYLIDHHNWAKTNSNATNARAEGYLRGLDCSDEYVKLMLEQRTKIRSILNDQVFSMLERWLSVVVKENKLKHACVSYTCFHFVFNSLDTIRGTTRTFGLPVPQHTLL